MPERGRASRPRFYFACRKTWTKKVSLRRIHRGDDRLGAKWPAFRAYGAAAAGKGLHPNTGTPAPAAATLLLLVVLAVFAMAMATADVVRHLSDRVSLILG